MTSIITIEGIGEKYAAALKTAGVNTVEQLLQAGATPKGRQELSEKSGVSDKLILEWVNHADLFRIKGVGEEYADLLEAAGVDTVVELAQRNAANLYQALVKANESKKLVRQLPTEKAVAAWIEQAKSLPRVVSY
jgi:predicted flap endonuclease-1-like 5' DNA nuclease